MAVDEWNIPTEPARALKRNVSDFRNGAEADLKSLSRKIDGLRGDINQLIHALNELVNMIKEEVQEQKHPIKKKKLPPPPLPP